VLRNTYFSRLRAAARRPRPDPLPEELDRLEDRSAAAPETALHTSELYALIAGLPDPFREALVAVDVVGLSYREAARALRVREATITTRLYRARQRLAHALRDEPGPAPAGTSG
jgi:RNA polymerase sigma-70 factor, ECF subfamily